MDSRERHEAACYGKAVGRAQGGAVIAALALYLSIVGLMEWGIFGAFAITYGTLLGAVNFGLRNSR